MKEYAVHQIFHGDENKNSKIDNYVGFVIRHTALVSVLSRMTYVAASD